MNLESVYNCLVFYLTVLLTQATVEFDNALQGMVKFRFNFMLIHSGKPEIHCGNGTMKLTIPTMKGPPSHVFAKCHFHNA